MSTSTVPRVAILDDYQSVALTSADWTSLKGRVSIDVYRDTLLDEDELAQRLEPYDIICAMRERTKFTATLFDKLPNLKFVTHSWREIIYLCKLLISRFIATTGPRNLGIDVAYAKTKGIPVSGTGGSGNATLEHIWALILATVRYITNEDANVKSGNPQWQSTMPMGLAGKTLGLVGVGRLGAQTAAVSNDISI